MVAATPLLLEWQVLPGNYRNMKLRVSQSARTKCRSSAWVGLMSNRPSRRSR
jgi:hypothetical protein